MSNRDDEEAVAVVGKTGESVVPGGESSQETDETTSHLDLLVRVTLSIVVEVGNTQQQEGQIKGEEQGEECNG